MNVIFQIVEEGFTLPYVLVSDEIFGLKTWLIKPDPGKDLSEEQKFQLQTQQGPSYHRQVNWYLNCTIFLGDQSRPAEQQLKTL